MREEFAANSVVDYAIIVVSAAIGILSMINFVLC